MRAARAHVCARGRVKGVGHRRNALLNGGALLQLYVQGFGGTWGPYFGLLRGGCATHGALTMGQTMGRTLYTAYTCLDGGIGVDHRPTSC